MTDAIEVYQPKQRNPMVIKNLCPGLQEQGKLKIGNKGAVRKSVSGNDWQAPQKLDHFLITTMERGQDNNFLKDEFLHKLYGDAPKEIPVRLIYDDISLNFATRYICYYGKTVFCTGDGETATRLQKDGTQAQRTCPCGRQDPKYTGDDGPNGAEGLGGKNSKGKCKINGILSVIIDGAKTVGGVWKFRTTSYNSVVGILSSLALIQRITGGRLAGIPMLLTVTPKTVQDPIQGSQQTIYVVGLQYAGTMNSLREVGYEIAMTEAKHGISMKRIEEDAMMMLTHTPTSGLGDDLAEDVVAEFYPEEMQPAAPALVEAAVEYPPLTAERATADQSNPIPPLATIQGEVVDTSTGEVMAGKTEPQKEKVAKSKEKAKVKETVVEPVTETATVGTDAVTDAVIVEAAEEQPPHPADEQEAAAPLVDEDDGFPNPPGKNAPAASGSIGDLF